MDNSFDFNQQPGTRLIQQETYKNRQPEISVIMPFFNEKKYIKQSIYSVLNQTFPYFELIIVNDGSDDKESIEKLEKISKEDKRIKIINKENEGPAAARDYGARKSNDCTKYLFFLDSDDLIEPTYLECAYWTLETNKDASWAYTDSVGFEGKKYLWNKWFDSDKMKKRNDLVATALIKKEDFWAVDGYNIKEKSISEDWNFWLKMIAHGFFPVRMNFYGFWYRIKESEGEHNRAKKNKKRDMQIIRDSANKIKKRVKAVQYPKFDYNWNIMKENIIMPKEKENNGKINILMIIPWMVTGGADKFNIDLIKRLDPKKYTVTVITTEPQINNYRQDFEKYATVYDLTTFLNQKYWISFIKYIIESENINFIINTNSRFGYAILPYLKAKFPKVPIIDYIHMEEWYNRNGGYSRDSSAVESIIDKTIVCNENSRNILINHFERKEENVKTVYIGVDEEKYDPSSIQNKQNILKRYNISNEGIYIIGFICRISAQKRPYLLVNIVEKLNKVRGDFLVVVAGDGDMLNEMKNLVRKKHLNNRIKFIGNIRETKEIYAISDITLNCSIKEGLALTSYESLAMGVPVISADVGGQKELIDDTVGKVVPCIQKEEEIKEFNYAKEEVQNYVIAIDDVLNNLNKYKENCRKRILEKFTINHMSRNMSEIIENVYQNPNINIIENGSCLANNINICKELVCMFFEENSESYKWQCIQYNSNYYELLDEYRVTIWSKTKEKLWTYPIYRVFIKILQKIGIMKCLKSILKKNNNNDKDEL